MVAVTEQPRVRVATVPAASGRLRAARRKVTTTGMVGAVVLGAVVLAAVVGPVVWPWGALDQDVVVRLQNPSLTHPFGTDVYGRDLFARMLMGGRWSLLGAATVCLGTNGLGFLVGMLAAMGSPLVDTLINRLVETVMAVPWLVIALALTAILGPSFPDLIFAMTITSWPAFARIYRTLIRKEMSLQYVEGAVVVGASGIRVVLRHVLPNVFGQALVLITFYFGSALLSLAGLSFLGLGIQPPTPEWGTMVKDALPYFQGLPWQMIAPGLCIAVTALAVNLTGDALRDLLDPRLTRR